jgi:hypothetical protein
MDLVLLPDSMYLIVPRRLPIFDAGHSAIEMCMEFGGIMRSGDGKLLRRTVLRFNTDGSLKSSRHDTFNISSP